MNNKITIGLFGTCGTSKWRDSFMEKYAALKINFFNPNTPDWKPEDAFIEAEHLANDQVILFPVTSESYGTGSLSEVGFSILQAIRLDDRRDFVILVDKDLIPSLNDEIARKESLRSRALVLEHLRKLRLRNVFVVDTLEEMLECSIKLYKSAVVRQPLLQYNPHETRTIVDVKNQEALQNGAIKVAQSIVKNARADFQEGANTYFYRKGERAGQKLLGWEKNYCDRIKKLIKTECPKWRITLLPIVNVVGREESTDGYDIKVSLPAKKRK